MLVEVVHILKNRQLSRDNNVVDGAQVLCVLRKTNTAGVRNNRHTKLLGHEEDSKDLVDTAHTAGVDLTHIDGTGLEELLEDNTVLAHLTSSDTNAIRLKGIANGLVAEDIIGGCRLLDEPRLEVGELLHVLNGLRNRPNLVGICHENIALVITNDLTSNTQTLAVALNVTTDLDLEVSVSSVESLLKQTLHLILPVSKPASARCVSGHSAVVKSLFETLGLGRLLLLKHSDSLLGGDSIGDVTEVNAADELLRAHVSDDAPDGLVEGLGPEIPDSVDDGTESQVDDTLLGTDPSELTVVDEMSPCLAPVCDEGGEGPALETLGDVVDGSADDVVSTADSEGLYQVSQLRLRWSLKELSTDHSVAGVFRVCLEDAVGGGIVASSVHGIGASSVERSRKANISSLPAGNCDFTHDCGLFCRFVRQLLKLSSMRELSEA